MTARSFRLYGEPGTPTMRRSVVSVIITSEDREAARERRAAVRVVTRMALADAPERLPAPVTLEDAAGGTLVRGGERLVVAPELLQAPDAIARRRHPLVARPLDD